MLKSTEAVLTRGIIIIITNKIVGVKEKSKQFVRIERLEKALIASIYAPTKPQTAVEFETFGRTVT